MARYIDADLLVENICKIEDLRTLSTKTIGEAISNTPTADVVEVVRCKVCKHSSFNKDSLVYRCDKRGYYTELVKPDGFCSEGERRDAE